MLLFVFPTDHISEESKRASVCPFLVWPLMSPSTFEGLTLHKSQMCKRWVEPLLSSFQYDDKYDDDWWWWQMQRPEGEVIRHSNHLKDRCFPHEISREMRNVLCNQPNFAAQKCTLSLFPAGSMPGRSGWLNFSHGQQLCMELHFKMTHKISVLTPANSDFIT